MKLTTCLSAMVALVLVGVSSSVATAAEPQQPAAWKKSVKVTVIQEKQSASDAGAKKELGLPTWQFAATLPKGQTELLALEQLGVIAKYVGAASGSSVTPMAQRNPQTREHQLTVTVKQLSIPSGDLIVTPDIPGLEGIETDSNCFRNSHLIVTLKPGTKLDEKQMLQVMDFGRFVATMNHDVDSRTKADINGIDPKTEMLTQKPTVSADGKIYMVVTFPEAALIGQQAVIGSAVPVVNAF